MNYTADAEEFAAKQGEIQKKDESYLLGSARAALRNVGKKGWYNALLRRVEQVARTAYRREADHVSSDVLRNRLKTMLSDIEKALAKTTKPEKDQLETRANALAKSLSSLANATGVEAAGVDSEDEIDFEWVTLHGEGGDDGRVRAAHLAANGQVRAPGEDYDVGGEKMAHPGDVTASIELWINCRCALRPVRREPDAIAAAATEYEEQGIGIFLLPADGEPILDISSENPPHVTVAFMGLTGEQDVDVEALQGAVQMVADEFAAVDVEVKARDTLGDEGADVAFLNRDQMLDLRESLIENDVIAEAMANVEQYPEWLPHLTLGYPETPANEGDLPSTIRLDRLALFVGKDHYEYPLGGEMADQTDAVEEDEFLDDEIDDLGEVDAAELVQWHGVLAPEGVATGDGRKFAVGSMRWRDLPLPLAFQKTNMPGHDGSVVTGRIDRLWRDEANLLQGEGTFLATPEADEHINLIAEGAAPGVSVDVDDATMSFEDEDGNEVTFDSEISPDAVITSVITDGRICGATGCSIPAFAEAYIALGPHPNPPEAVEPEAVAASADVVDLAVAYAGMTEEERAAAGTFTESFVKTEDGPGWVTHPVDTERLRRYWTKGKGAAKIRWGVPGDFNRCRSQLSKYVKPQYLSGYCANRHYDALGFWPGRPTSGERVEFGGTPFALVASADPLDYPVDWFSDPGFTHPTRLTITEDGRVFGHLAEWDVCHIGISGVCTTAPSSLSNYAYYATGVAPVGQDINVGVLTIGTGHAGAKGSARVAAAHYDNTGAQFAYVAIGEDDHGIWFSGCLAPGVTEEQIIEARAAGSVSGDWRRIGDGLELVAALVVNVPGFPITPTQIAASGGHQTALVASGIVVDKEKRTLQEIVASAVEETLAMRERRERLADLKRQTGRDNASRMERIKAERVH